MSAMNKWKKAGMGMGFALFALSVGSAESQAAPSLEDTTRIWLQLPDEAKARVRFLESVKAESDRSRMAWGAVALALDDLAHGRGAAAQQWKKQAEKLAPNARVLLLLDSGELMRKCSTCTGDGYQKTPCSICRRTGSCTACKGKGNLDALQRSKRGRPDRHRCPGCNGTGKCAKCVKGEKRTPCVGCGGRGKEIDAPKAARRWQRVLKAGPGQAPLEE